MTLTAIAKHLKAKELVGFDAAMEPFADVAPSNWLRLVEEGFLST